MKRCGICKVVTVLGGIGALNWGLVALLNFNIIAAILGDMTMPAKIVYILVGISGLILLVSLFKVCPACSK